MPDPINLTADLPYFAVAVLAGYFLGSIPFGIVLTRLAGLGDIRQIGSGNIGATNVLRTGNKWIAAATLLLDSSKGALAVLLGKNFGPDIAVLAAAGALFGHLFPVWLKFRGGKGVATAMGIYVALYWPVGLMTLGTWLAVAVFARYSSLAALIAAVLAPVYFWFSAQYQMAELAAFMALFIVLKHHQNIRRLIMGTESKIGSQED